jgi:hypothetical protein
MEQQNTQQLYHTHDFMVIKTNITWLKQNYRIENFSLNREPDEKRIDEIAKHFIDNKVNFMTHFICAWQRDKDTLEVYDGIHRIQACLHHNINMSFILKISIGTKKQALKDFIDINKSISVPSTYLDGLLEKSSKTVIIENVMKKICSKFRPCMSASRHPQRQNFNRDNFIEILSEIPETCFDTPRFEDTLYTTVLQFNEKCKKLVLQSSVLVMSKTHEHQFWINYIPSHKFVNYLLENTK